MPSELVEDVVFSRLFTFLLSMRTSQFSEEMTINDRPKPHNYPAYIHPVVRSCVFLGLAKNTHIQNLKQFNEICISWIFELLFENKPE